MKKVFKSLISLILVISTIICATVPAFAVDEEEYICELRLIYADSYKEAKEILSKSDFKDYKLLKENLNDGSGQIGVWLAYKTTTDIEDAITDISAIQMCGGYKQGNYQEMIKQSYDEYIKMGVIYKQAIQYFAKAYDEGHFLAEAAYRQLNFYNVVSEGIPTEKIPPFEGQRIGDIFRSGIDEYQLATMFFEGNTYALQNIRSLIAMGVSYNEDGMSYLDKVDEEAKKLQADNTLYANEDYDDLAALIAPTIPVIKNMLKELSAYEAELNYTDAEFTDAELQNAENKAVADMLRDVDYLGGKTLYQFCLDYESGDDYSELYPLVAALNEGQIAMTRVAHYYDVIRYSASSDAEEVISDEIDKLWQIYSEEPFNVYSGVDRSIFDGTFALTNDAYRADVYGEGGIGDALFGGDRWEASAINIATGTVGLGFFVGSIAKRSAENTAAAATPAGVAAKQATETLRGGVEAVAQQNIITSGNAINITLSSGETVSATTYGDVINVILVKKHILSQKALASYSMFDKYQLLMAKSTKFAHQTGELSAVKHLTGRLENHMGDSYMSYKTYQATLDAGAASHVASNLLFLVGAIMLLYSAYNLIMTVYNYYHPAFEDIPLAMVDMINTVDGDRYIKYDAVFNAETNEDGIYEAADLNAFAAERWNALYYTKSYEAGKPLLADEFSVSNRSNKPKDNYAPVHRFGEVVCYDLNKYNFEGNTSIYLSVKQSKHDKSAVADVPEVVGSMLSAGFLFLAGGIGAALGVGGTIITQKSLKKKRSGAGSPDTSAEDTADT